MKKHHRARRLAELISPYLYSEASIPKALNDLFLHWLNTHDVPEIGDILIAAHADDKKA